LLVFASNTDEAEECINFWKNWWLFSQN